MTKTIQLLAVATVASFVGACGQTNDPWVELASGDQRVSALDQYGLLDFVNDQKATTLERLDIDCALHADTARYIIAHRDGTDGVPYTDDDNLFDSIAELEDVYQVGPWNLEQIYYCAKDAGYLFADEPGLLAFVNDAETTLEILDVDCAIRSDSARNVIKARDGRDKIAGTEDDATFGSIRDLEAVKMVGIWTLGQLYNCADNFGYLTMGQTPATPPAPTPESKESNEARITYEWNLNNLDAELRTLIEDDLMSQAQEMRDTSVYFDVRFAEVEIHWVGETVVRYDVKFVQMIDPEGGIQLWIIFNVDADLNVTDSRIYI